MVYIVIKIFIDLGFALAIIDSPNTDCLHCHLCRSAFFSYTPLWVLTAKLKCPVFQSKQGRDFAAEHFSSKCCLHLILDGHIFRKIKI